MTTQTRNIVLSILFIVALAPAGCREIASQYQTPPKQQVQGAVRAALPPFLSLDSIELEPIPTGPEAVKVNFKAIVTPKEDLYQVDREVEGTPPVTLLKVVQAVGTEVSLYGSVEARRTMDQWTLESPEIQVGLRQFGAPRGAFPAQSYVTGSNEAKEALRQQAANAAEIERARKAAQAQRELEQKALLEQQAREAKARQEREEQARIVLEEQRKKEMEQRKKEEEERRKEEAAAEAEARQKLILATVAGTRYIGTLSYEGQRQRLRFVFTEQKGFVIRAEASNPDKPQQKQTFTGDLVFNPPPEKDGSVYPIIMSPIEGIGDEWEVWSFYRRGRTGSLKLRLTDTGLEGEAHTMWLAGADYTIRLQREGAPPAKTPATEPRRGPDGIVRPPSAQPPESPQAPQPEPPRSP
jgi:hypothetical protein